MVQAEEARDTRWLVAVVHPALESVLLRFRSLLHLRLRYFEKDTEGRRQAFPALGLKARSPVARVQAPADSLEQSDPDSVTVHAWAFQSLGSFQLELSFQQPI